VSSLSAIAQGPMQLSIALSLPHLIAPDLNSRSLGNPFLDEDSERHRGSVQLLRLKLMVDVLLQEQRHLSEPKAIGQELGALSASTNSLGLLVALAVWAGVLQLFDPFFLRLLLEVMLRFLYRVRAAPTGAWLPSNAAAADFMG
jgi:hypothetical protein